MAESATTATTTATVPPVYPTFDRLLVRRLDSESRTPGGIVLPDNARKKSQRGIVLAAGPGRRGDDGRFQGRMIDVGNKVLFNQYAGTEIEVESEEYLILREEDILAVVG